MYGIRRVIVDAYGYMSKKTYTPHRELNCIQLCLKMIAKIFRCDYEYIFLEAWEFDLSRKEETGDKYGITNIEYNERSIELICKYTNLQCKKYSGNNVKETIEQLSNDYIALAEIDTYYCPWSPGYNDSHFTYYFFIFRNDEGNIDTFGPYDNTYYIALNDAIISNIRNIYFFFIEENSGKEITNLDILYHINKAISQHGNQFDNIIDFSNSIDTIICRENILENKKYNQNRFLQRIIYVELSRKTLKIFIEKFINEKETRKMINGIISDWIEIKNKVIKIVCYGKEKDIESARVLLEKVANKEKCLYIRISKRLLAEKYDNGN